MLEFPFCDPGEARTLDPMIKSHLLYQLSYGVSFLFVSGAKVIRIFESASISAEKIDFVCYFFCFFGDWRHFTWFMLHRGNTFPYKCVTNEYGVSGSFDAVWRDRLPVVAKGALGAGLPNSK